MTPPFFYHLTKKRKVERVNYNLNLSNPPKDRIILETLYTAISPGTELSAFLGMPPLRPTTKKYPRLMGYCNISRIISMGLDVQGYEIGDTVMTHSAHRSNDSISANEILCTIDGKADLVSASTTYLFHLGYSACLKANITLGHSVAIVGLGVLGATSAAVASLSGASVDGFSNHNKLEKNYKKFGIRNIVKKSELLMESSYDVVISTSNSWDDWMLALKLVRPGGTISVLGFPGRGQTPNIENPLCSSYFYDKQITLSACGYVPDVEISEQDLRFTLKRNCKFLLSLILKNKLPAKELIIQVKDAEELPTIYEEMTKADRDFGTYVLDWNGKK